MKRKVFALLMAAVLLLPGVPTEAAEGDLPIDVISEQETTEKEITVESGYADLRNRQPGASPAVNEDRAAVSWSEDYFGSQLEPLAKELYDVMKTAYVDQQSGAETAGSLGSPVTFEAELAGGSIVENESYRNAVQTVSTAFQCASSAFLTDHPEVFWIGNFRYTYRISVRGNIGTIQNYTIYPNEYYAGAYQDTEAFWEAISESIAQIRQNAEDEMSRYDLAKVAHDYLCSILSYNYDAVGNADQYPMVHTAACAFVGDHMAVCEGYAKAYKVLCDQLKIPCVLVIGVGVTSGSDDMSRNHMWNYVQMKDSQWYGVDTTWDDQSEIQYNYFLAGNNTWGFYAKFSQDHLPDANLAYGVDYAFSYPPLAEDTYENNNDYRPVIGITADKTEFVIVLGETVVLEYMLEPADATCQEVEFVSSDLSVAQVSADGTVTGIAPGEVTVTATSTDGGFSVEYTIMVTGSKITKGDINEDGTVSVSDLLMCLHHISGSSILTGNAFSAAEINGNGDVDVTDLLRILHYISGSVEEL